MREEKVTKIMLDWLEYNAWKIICYDFPQSGTGVLLHPNGSNRKEKNKGGIIPDIIAVKDNVAVFFENKDRFYEPDFDKLQEIKKESNYSNALDKLLTGFHIEVIYYGIAIPELNNAIEKSKLHLEKIDFLVSINEKEKILIHYDKNRIFATP